MHIFQNTLNTRSILEDSMKYIRSDVRPIRSVIKRICGTESFGRYPCDYAA